MQKKGESQRRWDVIGFGENSVDTIVTLGRLPKADGKVAVDQVAVRPGGQIATAMVGCARLGLRSAYVGTFGTDAGSAPIRAALARAKVTTSLCRRVAVPNRSAVILVETARGTRTVIAHRDPALAWPPAEVPIGQVGHARALLIDGTDPEAAGRMAGAARRSGTLVVADIESGGPVLDGLAAVVDILVVPSGLARQGRRLLRHGPRVVVATLGAAGAVAWDGRAEVFSPGFVVPVVDSTGAGDAFRAGLVAAVLEVPGGWQTGLPLPQILEFANACAALNCLGHGAQSGLPTRAEVARFVTERPRRRSKSSWERLQVQQRSADRRRGDRR